MSPLCSFDNPDPAYTEPECSHQKKATPKKSSPTPFFFSATAPVTSPAHFSTKTPNRKAHPLFSHPKHSSEHQPHLFARHLVHDRLALARGDSRPHARPPARAREPPSRSDSISRPRRHGRQRLQRDRLFGLDRSRESEVCKKISFWKKPPPRVPLSCVCL